ncbi:MAG: hypothetical protein HQ534_09450 [Armatimonadetes bacterium]|nr:hypothetical protein [Armatimonadota bacterium]
MNTHKFTLNQLLLLILGFLLLIGRSIWEYLLPLRPADYKGIIYFRDILILLPATILIGSVLIRTKYNKSLSRLFDSVIIKIRRMKNKPIGITTILSFIIFVECILICILVFKTRAHIWDEANYLFQAKLFAAGKLWVNPPVVSGDFFNLRLIVLTSEKWFGSFFPGHSLILTPGVLLGISYAINPILTAILLIVTVWAGSRLFSKSVGLISGAFMILSPFVLFQGASYFSHILTAIFFTIAVVWILNCNLSDRWKPLGIGLCCGMVLLCRPFSALILVIFTCFYWILRAKHNHLKIKIYSFLSLVVIGILPFITLFLGYNFCLTGNPFVTPHQIALPNETIGLGVHTIKNTLINLTGLSVDLLGIPLLSLLPFSVYLFSRENRSKAICLLTVFYIIGYGLYRNHGLSYGPRFYFELFPLMLATSGRGLMILPNYLFPKSKNTKVIIVKFIFIFWITTLLISILGVLPSRFSIFHQRGVLYNIENLVTQSVKKPALVLISNPDEKRIYPYMAGFQLNNVNLDGSIIYARSLLGRNKELLASYPKHNYYLLDVKKRLIIPYSPCYELPSWNEDKEIL